jgi:D-threo-aldose 1-dehydrogenase
MESNNLGSTVVQISELGFGGGPIGGLFQPVDHDTAQSALAEAWTGGVRYFDTAPHYGIGQSESWFGEFLRHQPRNTFTLSTKVGRFLVPQDPAGRMDEAFQVPATHRRVWDFSRDGVRRSLADSLARMGLDRADIVYLHDVEAHFDEALRSGYPALAELRDEGMVGAIGAGMGDAGLLARLVQETDVDVVMLAGRYTLLDQSGLDEVLPACSDRGVSVVAAAVFNSGVLAQPRPAAGAMYGYEEASPAVLERANRIADACAAHGVALPQAAMAFPLTHPAVAGVVVGMRSPDEVREKPRRLRRCCTGPAVERPSRRRPARRTRTRAQRSIAIGEGYRWASLEITCDPQPWGICDRFRVRSKVISRELSPVMGTA